jgi:hypothetical protein
MQSFDTIKIEIPNESVVGVNWHNFMETNRIDMDSGASELFRKAKNSTLPVGVSSITWKENGDFMAEFSAKVLKDNYLQGINLNTFGESLHSMNQVLKIDENRLLDGGGRVLKCDATNNISLESLGCKHDKVYNSLLSSGMNPLFLPISYNSKRKAGIEFRGTQQEKNRLIAYSKHLDLLKGANKEFMASLVNPSKMIQDSSNQVRIESNHTSFKAIRSRFKVEENTILKVLNSDALVNHDFLYKVLYGKGSIQSELFDEWNSFDGSFNEFIMLKGTENIIQLLGTNDIAVRNFFKQGFQDRETFNYHFHRKKHSIKQVLNNIKAKKYGVQVSEANDICSRLLSILKAA